MRLTLIGVVSFVLFAVVLDFLAYEFRLPHRGWAPGIAVGLAGAVVLVARRLRRRSIEQSVQR